MRPATTLGPDASASVAPEFDRHRRVLAAALGTDDPIEDSYELSAVQEAMLFHAVGSAASDLYIVQQRLVIEGNLALDPFQRAWSLVVSRHPALRSAFAWEHGGSPRQLVCRNVEVDVKLADVSTLGEADAVIDAGFAVDRQQRYALDVPPLMRIALFRVAPDRHVMLWSQHHLLQDGWSSAVVLDEVFAAYEALRDGRDPELGPARPFRDFVEWLRRRQPEESASFWREHLAGFTEPTRMSHPATVEPGGYTRRFRALTPEVTAGVRDFARSQRVSLNTVLVGALAIVLARYTGRPDVAFGTVAAGRPPTLPGVESMVGMFINTLVLRIPVEVRATVGDWLGAVQARQASLFDHEHDALSQVQSWSEVGPGTTLTDVLFAYWNFGAAGASPDGSLTYRTVDGYGRTSFPFSVTVEGSDPIKLGVDFDVAEVEVATAERFLGHYANVLAAMVAAPDDPVGSLAMLDETEVAALRDFNATTRSVPFATILEAFAAQVAATPDAVAATCGDTTVTYAELDQRSDRLARELRGSGPHPPRVGIFLERSIEMLVAVWGTLKAGAAYVPIDRHSPAERIELLLGEAGTDVVVTASHLRGELPATAQRVIVVAEDADVGPVADLPEVTAQDLAYVMFTSGSTGVPKGVMITHRSLVNYVWWAAQEYGGGEATTFPLYSSVAFDLTVTSMFVPLVTGGRIVVYPDEDARDLSVLEVFADDAVDVVKLTPSHLALLEPGHLATHRIRSLILGGEDLTVALAAATHRASGDRLAIFNEYGPTEATVGCMIHRFDPQVDTAGSVPIGRPAANTRIYLLDASLAPVPQGASGELYVAGDGVAAGYLDRPDLTQERFVADPFRPGEVMYRTGDRARWNAHGLIEYLGRDDDQVKVRGYRLEPAEIERVLASHPSVAEAAVTVRQLRPGDVRLVAYYVADALAVVNLTDLRTHLQHHLPAYMVPPHLVRMDALPITPNGKLDRKALPETLGETVTSATHIAPRNDAERLVADLGSELLGVDQVSLGDNFFDLGGHSVLAMQLIARLHAATGVRISPRVILLNTLEQAAALLPHDEVATAPTLSAAGAAAEERATGTSAFFFGPSAQPLFGLRHTPAADRSRGESVLLCPPVGWEYMRTHRALRSLGRRLGLEGFSVLRFDYCGTGDSFGEAGAGSLRRWVDDVATAAAELGAGGDGRLTIVGLRLGAALASLAVTAGLEVDRLVLWDPVVRGAQHLADLERMHAEMLANRPAVPPGTSGDELLGFRYPPELRTELGDLDLTRSRALPVPVYVLASRASAAVRLDGADVQVVPDAGAWDDLASAQAALLPAAIPNRIVDLLLGSA